MVAIGVELLDPVVPVVGHVDVVRRVGGDRERECRIGRPPCRTRPACRGSFPACELLDAVVATIGHPHVAVAVHGHVDRIVELAVAAAGRPEGAQPLSVGAELLDPVVGVVGHVQVVEAVRVEAAAPANCPCPSPAEPHWDSKCVVRGRARGQRKRGPRQQAPSSSGEVSSVMFPHENAFAPHDASTNPRPHLTFGGPLGRLSGGRDPLQPRLGSITARGRRAGGRSRAPGTGRRGWGTCAGESRIACTSRSHRDA